MRSSLPKSLLIARNVMFALTLLALFITCSSTAAFVAASHHTKHPLAFAPTPTALPTRLPSFPNLGAIHPTGSDFADYYAGTHGANWLGQALTPELADAGGMQQVFTYGIIQRGSAANAPAVAQPIAETLIAHGAAIPIADSSSDVTYATLFPASVPAARVTAPWWWQPTANPAEDGIFTAEETRNNVAYGHYIPATFVPYLQSLGNWQQILGATLTEVQTAHITVNGSLHRFSVLAFANGVLWYDRDADGAPAIHEQPVGKDALAMFGYPHVQIAAGRGAWTLPSPMTVASAPGKQDTIATFLTPFSVHMAGDAKWLGNTLWYHIRWKNLMELRDGWVNADQLAFDKPRNAGMQLAALNALSPQLQADASAYGANVTMAIYDPESDHYYVYNPYEGLEMASMFKVPIIVTLMHDIEVQGRDLTSDEAAEATSMIEVSDNIAEVELYDDAGGYWGVTNYLNSIGITDLDINTGGIGSTLLSPLSTVRLMEMIRAHRILTPAHCDYILNLMANVVPSQQVGVAATAPPGASWAMKIGYGPGMDTLWLMDSMGTVTYKGHSYDLAIYSRDSQDFASGAYIVNHLCSEAVQALVGVP